MPHLTNRVSGIFLPSLVGVFAIASSPSPQTLPYEAPLYALLAVVTAAIALVKPRGVSLPASGRTLSAVWLFICVIYAGVALVQVDPEASYIIGDLVVAVMPLLMLLCFVTRPHWLETVTPLHIFCILALLAAVLARLIGLIGTRHDPPSALLIAASWYFLITARNFPIRAVYLCVVALAGYLSFTSGYRTHTLLWLATPIIILFVCHGWKALFRGLAFATAGLVIATLAGVDFEFEAALSSTRFESLAQGQDISLNTRFLEAQDVIRTAQEEWPLHQYLVGEGFGASYQPDVSYISKNVADNGRVHNVHIGPVLVVYRFGLVGVATMLALTIVIVNLTRRLRQGDLPPERFDTATIYVTSLILLLAQFMVLNSTVEPIFALSTGAVLAHCLLQGESTGRTDALRSANPCPGMVP